MLDWTKILLILVLLHCQALYADDALLSFLIEQNEAAKEKIETAEYSVKWFLSFDLEGRRGIGLQNNEGIGKVKRKGDQLSAVVEVSHSRPGTAWKQKSTVGVAVNNRYLAYWPAVENPNIYQFDHQSIEAMSGKEEIIMELELPPDRFAFGTAFGTAAIGESFKEAIERLGDEVKWTAEEVVRANGEKQYLIRQFSPYQDDPTEPSAVWTVDPQKGFLVTQAVHYSRAGNVWVDRKISPKEISSGIWIPAFYEHRKYGSSEDPQPRAEPSETYTVQLSDISVNHEILDDEFAIEAIWPEKYRKTTTLIRTGLDGNVEAYVRRRGMNVPADMWRGVDRLLDKAIEEEPPLVDLPEPVKDSKSQSVQMDTSLERTESPDHLLAVQISDRRRVYVFVGISGIALLVLVWRVTRHLSKNKTN